MLRRQLGDTGLKVSVLGLGTVKFGRNSGVDYPQRYALPSDGRVADLLASARSHGINLLDTAPAYGTSEARLGEAIEGQRNEWVVCTKAGEEFDGTASRYNFHEDHILRSVARSLRRLRTDTLDIVLMHSDGRSVDEIEDVGGFRALRRLQHEGVVRALGFSGKSATDARTALARSGVLMCTVNACYRDEVGLVAEAARQGTGVLVKKPLAGGLDRDSETIAQIACLDGVTSVVVGTIEPDHLAANAAAVLRACTPDSSCIRRLGPNGPQ